MKYSVEWLKQYLIANPNAKWLYFWSHTAKPGESIGRHCLSQWFERPFKVGTVVYPTAEHWMMAEKARLFGDDAIVARVLAARTPGEAKQPGREIQHFDEEKWQSARCEIVRIGNEHKFDQHPDLAAYLVQTGSLILVEASPVDAVWGIGLAHDDPRAADPDEWPGLNLLGFTLMTVRDALPGYRFTI